MASIQTPGSVRKPTIVVIEERALFRDCLRRCLGAISDCEVAAVTSVEAWEGLSKSHDAVLFVLCIPDSRKREKEFQRLLEWGRDVPTIVVSHEDELSTIVDALEGGARGFIPTSMSLDAVIAAIKFVSAGGVFVPAGSLLSAARQRTEGLPAGKAQANSLFTARQAAVVEALRRGKANKLIAYELNMCESTVKVHVRKIMRKLKATNRTQVAFLTNELLNRESVGAVSR